MWNGEEHARLLADRLNLLCEIEQISQCLTVYEQRYGAFADLDDLRLRVQAVRLAVLTQVRLLTPATETIH